LKIIDAHLHFSNTETLKNTAEKIAQVEYSAKGLKREFKEADVVAGVVMTTGKREPGQANSKAMELSLDDGGLNCLLACIGVNPLELEKDSSELDYIEKELANDWVTGIKLYPGYFPYYVYDPVYDPIYELAKKYQVPVAIHCGSTQSPQGLLKYSHPLTIDELAVKHQDINFIICHLGAPWVMDTAEIIAKNGNVYTDLSGLIAGNKAQVEKTKDIELYLNFLKQSLVYAHRYDKVLYGSDWPLVPIKPYIEFIKKLIPEDYHEDVFYHNAVKVFPKMQGMLDLLKENS